MTNVEAHKQICEEIHALYERKNHDYGNSFKMCRTLVPNAIIIRVFDKAFRLNTLMNGAEQKVLDESIEDTLTDLANYCLMELAERRVDKEEQSHARDS